MMLLMVAGGIFLAGLLIAGARYIVIAFLVLLVGSMVALALLPVLGRMP